MSSVNPCVIDMFVSTLKKLIVFYKQVEIRLWKLAHAPITHVEPLYIWYKFIMINLLIYSTN